MLFGAGIRRGTATPYRVTIPPPALLAMPLDNSAARVSLVLRPGVRVRELVSPMRTLALAGGQDPYQFRRRLMIVSPKELAVPDAVAEKADWNRPLPRGLHRGIAVEYSYGNYCAHIR